MMRPQPETTKALALAVRQFPEIQRWVDDWCAHEMEQLPSVGQNVALAQGRCQVLKELRDIMKKALELATKPRQG